MKLYSHQERALKQTENMNRVAYYHDMGLGKTFTGAEKMNILGARVNLIICQKSKVKDWVNHFNKHYLNNDVFILSYDLTKKREFEQFVLDAKRGCGRCVGIINYELAFRRKELLELHDFTLMLDESSLIQNKQAKRTDFILKMNVANVILLSGTPTSGKYENLWSQIHLLGWDIKEETYQKQYVNRVLIEDDMGFKHKVVSKRDPYKNVERLKSKMREYGAHFMKTEECFELPEQVFIQIKVPTSKEYRRFDKKSIITIDGVELVGDTQLTKRMYKRMLCGQYSKEKLEAFKELAESTKDRLIVFYNFNEELQRLKVIAEELERPISEVNGNVKDLTAYENESDSITFVQYQAGAMGLNLQKANKIVYFTIAQSSELFEQSKKRTHRIGQTKTCFYYTMLCEKSIEEEDILRTLKIRKDYTDELFRENLR